MVKYCTNCGTQMEDDALFCINCGTKSEFKVNSNSKNNKGFLNQFKKRSDDYQKNLKKTGRKRAKIPHFGGINEIREDCLVIKNTNEVIMIKDIENFSLHQSSQSLWSDVKVDFDYNGLHYRTQQAGTDKGKLQTVEKKINAMAMSKFTKEMESKNSGERKVEKLKELKQLKDDGIIDDAEFAQIKAEIMNGE